MSGPLEQGELRFHKENAATPTGAHRSIVRQYENDTKTKKKLRRDISAYFFENK